MVDELTLKVGRRGAQLLVRELARSILRSYGDERRYLEAIYNKLKKFIDTPPSRHVEYKIISKERYGSKEDRK